MENQVYNGFDIKFDQKEEVWYATVDEKGKQAKYDEGDNRVQDKSLKKLKEKLDMIRRSKFERMPVFVRAQRYRLGGGRDEKYETQYVEATVTSISPNGNAYTVKKGEKTGEKHSLRYDNSNIIIDTPKNRKIIAQIEVEGENEWRAEREQVRLKETLEQLDGAKVYKQVYGKDIE